ncbi:hypothetical protein OSJ07_24765 [Mycobacterium ulcerans]
MKPSRLCADGLVVTGVGAKQLRNGFRYLVAAADSTETVGVVAAALAA